MRKLHHKLFYLALILSGLCFSIPAYSQEQDSVAQQIQLNSLTVNALAIPVTNHDFGGMIGVLTKKDLSTSDPTILTEQFNRIPGVWMQSGTFTTNRISIRGVGSRSAFGTNKIRAYFGEIPLTDGGGETSLEDIDVSFIESVEIIKGPNSTLYGSGLGGAILLSPKMDTTHSASIRALAGTYGLLRIGGLVTRATDGQSLTLGVQRQTFDGYRENNSSEKNTLFTSFRKASYKNEFQFLSIYQGLKAFIPSSIGGSDFLVNPRQAAANWAAAKGYEDYTKWLAGLSWKHTMNERTVTSISIYANRKNNYEPRPFNILEDRLTGAGFRARVTMVTERFEWNMGVEGYRDNYHWSTYENQLVTNEPGSHQGELLSSNSEKRSFTNAFAQSIFHLTPITHFETGLNLNFTSYKFKSQAEIHEMSFEPVLSPRLSVVQEINDQLNVFGTVSHGFSPPSIEQTLDSSGDFNRDIQPETGWNREVGIKGAFQKVSFSFSKYTMDIRKLLVTQRTAEDVTFGKNAGSTRHKGWEASADVLLFQHGVHNWRVTGNFSQNNYTFRKFIDNGNNYSGNLLTGVPKNQWGFSVIQEGKRVFSGVNFLGVSEIPIADDNIELTQNYSLLNTFIGVRFRTKGRLNTELTYRINNVTNEKYAAMLNVNAQKFGSAEPRYFYPGMPRNHQVSVVIGWTR